MRTTFLIKLLLLCLVLNFQINQANSWGFFRRIARAISRAVRAVVTVLKKYHNTSIYMDGHQCSIQGTSHASCNITRSGVHMVMTYAGRVPLVNFIDMQVINHALLKKRYYIRYYNNNNSKSIQTFDMYQINNTLHYDFKNQLVNNANAYKAQYRTWARELIKLFGQYEGAMREKAHADQQVNHQRINSLNSSIGRSTNDVNLRVAKKENLKITTNENNLKASKVKDNVSTNGVKVDNCKAQKDAVQGTIALYQNYKTEFTVEKSYNFLAIEQSNLCTFHIHADDLILLIPTEMNTLNKERAFLVRNRKSETVKQLLNGSPFYIYDKDLQGDESTENGEDVIDNEDIELDLSIFGGEDVVEQETRGEL
jgi:hypothetical protein